MEKFMDYVCPFILYLLLSFVVITAAAMTSGGL